MTEKNAPRRQPKDDREARLKAALKANLGRRKAQAKVRRDSDTDADKTGNTPKEQDNG